MRHLLNNSRSVAASAAAALVLAACGGGSGEPAAENTAAAEQPEQTEGTTSDQTPTETEGDTEQAGADPFADLKVAAHHVGNEGTAKALAAGIVSATGMEDDVESPAAQTYATLSTLLQEHVYLASIAVDTGYAFGLDSPEFEAAAAQLDENSVELSEVVGGAVGQDEGEAFLSLWREHIGFFVDYAEAAAEGDQEGIEKAKSDLEGYGQQAGAFFEEVSGGAIPSSAVQESLKKHVATLGATIEAAAAGDASVFDKMRESATAVGEQGSAKALAAGFAQALEMEGDVESPAAQTYATLSTILEEHVYLSGIAVKTAYAAGLDSPEFEAATTTLDANSVELSEVVGSVAGEEKGQAFLSLWREHIGFFVDYAEAAAGDDQQGIEQAKSDLEGYGKQSGAFFEEISGGEIPSDAVQQSLAEHVDTLGAAIESLAAVLVN